jgi:hypothetical protein
MRTKNKKKNELWMKRNYFSLTAKQI